VAASPLLNAAAMTRVRSFMELAFPFDRWGFRSPAPSMRGIVPTAGSQQAAMRMPAAAERAHTLLARGPVFRVPTPVFPWLPS
jgi:hypothetical protein